MEWKSVDERSACVTASSTFSRNLSGLQARIARDLRRESHFMIPAETYSGKRRQTAALLRSGDQRNTVNFTLRKTDA
jgi:hypothetical protein